MATYTPHSWTSHELITSALLNNMEQGIKTAQDTANKAADAQELRAAFDMLAETMQAAIRNLDKRLSALETP